MLGVNIAQSQQEEETKPKRTGFFDTGTIISIVLVTLSVAVWGGIRLYIASLDTKIADVDVAIVASSGKLTGDTITKIADFDARVSFFDGTSSELMEPAQMLKKLEDSTVPGVVVTSFEYNHETGVTVLAGKTDDFRILAGQILNYKSMGLFALVEVQKIDRDEDGKIRFVLEAN